MGNRFRDLPDGMKSLLLFSGVFVAICGVLAIWVNTF